MEGTDGRLWFATTQGIASLDPAAVSQYRNRLAPPVVSSIAANGRMYPARGTLALPRRIENIQIVRPP